MSNDVSKVTTTFTRCFATKTNLSQLRFNLNFKGENNFLKLNGDVFNGDGGVFKMLDFWKI